MLKTKVKTSNGVQVNDNLNMNGNRAVNAADAVDTTDLATRRQVKIVYGAEWLIGTDKPAGNTVQDNELIGASIVGPLYLDNAIVMMRNSGITFDPATGTLDFSSINGLYANSILEVLFKK